MLQWEGLFADGYISRPRMSVWRLALRRERVATWIFTGHSPTLSDRFPETAGSNPDRCSAIARDCAALTADMPPGFRCQRCGPLPHNRRVFFDFTLSPPKSVSIAALVGNPHIQGSNLFVRLNALLEAGAFDESLASTTDRDLCIRLADLGWAPLASPTVRHHAEA